MGTADLAISSDAPKPSRRRALFFSEAVTLAHAARPVVLARALHEAGYEVHLAWSPRYKDLFGSLPFSVRTISSLSSEQFLARLARGAPLYDAATLRDYVREDLDAIRAVSPDVIVGDFRLSLAVSARVARIPYLAICNAYWSPYARQRFPLPDLPMTRVLGVPLATAVFRMARPLAFASHTRPLNRVRREYGLPSLGFDLRRTYTEADHTLYADVPELVPTFDLPDHHHYLGPVLWSPEGRTPEWWGTWPAERPNVYVTLGSSGRSDLLDVVLRALADLPVNVLVATAGRVDATAVPENALVSDYLPGEDAARIARLVICNGGSPTTQQALAAGVPILGLPSNLDQYLNMGAVRRTGAGEFLRAGSVDQAALRSTVAIVLERSDYLAAAVALSQTFARYDAPSRFVSFVDEAVLPIRPTSGSLTS